MKLAWFDFSKFVENQTPPLSISNELTETLFIKHCNEEWETMKFAWLDFSRLVQNQSLPLSIFNEITETLSIKHCNEEWETMKFAWADFSELVENRTPPLSIFNELTKPYSSSITRDHEIRVENALRTGHLISHCLCQKNRIGMKFEIQRFGKHQLLLPLLHVIKKDYSHHGVLAENWGKHQSDSSRSCASHQWWQARSSHYSKSIHLLTLLCLDTDCSWYFLLLYLLHNQSSQR